MSNRPKSPNRPAGAAASADRRKNLLVILAVVGVVVVVGVIAALAASEDDGSDVADFGPVGVQGTILTRLPDGGADPVVGDAAPRVEGVDPDGGVVVIGEPGEPTIAFFLAHWCPHCQAEVPVIQDWVDSGGLPEDVDLYGVSTGVDPRRPNYPPARWLDEEGWTSPVLVDGNQAAAQAVGLTAYPFFVVVDADGAVVARGSGELTADQLSELAALAAGGAS